MGRIVLVTGGARSGKSSFAEKIASEISLNVGYIATSQCFDTEMERRIELHRLQRPAYWPTYEEPFEIDTLVNTIGNKHDVLLLDCITLFISNMMFKDEIPENPSSLFWDSLESIILEKIKSFLFNSKLNKADLIIVTNELGSGIVPFEPLSRSYRDIVGRANQLIAKEADKVYLVCSGLPLMLKGGNNE